MIFISLYRISVVSLFYKFKNMIVYFFICWDFITILSLYNKIYNLKKYENFFLNSWFLKNTDWAWSAQCLSWVYIERQAGSHAAGLLAFSTSLSRLSVTTGNTMSHYHAYLPQILLTVTSMDVQLPSCVVVHDVHIVMKSALKALTSCSFNFRTRLAVLILLQGLVYYLVPSYVCSIFKFYMSMSVRSPSFLSHVCCGVCYSFATLRENSCMKLS